MDIDSLLKPFQRFGIHLGLERIERLLADLGNPHHRVPIIHVAGTNGKGSVCAYLSAVLTEAGYRVGRYTSPHLVDWNERICLNEQPISTETLQELLLQIKAAIPQDSEDSPTQFEVITAAAWLYFAQQQVDIAVIEVGLGGRLDATNVCETPLVTIITSLSREHWQNLGPTLAHIAREKAGILKPGCPTVVGQLPAEAKAVVEQRIKELECPTVWVEPARRSTNALAPTEDWAQYEGIKYPLPLLGEIQLSNSAIAIATLQILRSQGWKIPEAAISSGMAKAKWPGRLQWTTWKNHRLLIDGAHNRAAAKALRQYVDTLNTPVTWVMGILSTKDHADIFEALLRPGDRLYLVPVPDHSSADPNALAILARTICPELADCCTYPDLEKGLEAATSNPSKIPERLIVLCGSLYLIGYFFKHNHR
ncbi:MAG TPA: bifunctional folylpolyglutamate synthase/dihydrofolate synthase [Cyanobacteria bacterium UBA8553]|nr:bifunctional folylpolyglutamate synthase/dihydrofolate synthase [Cyanobacteria bacterium UBA8553]